MRLRLLCVVLLATPLIACIPIRYRTELPPGGAVHQLKVRMHSARLGATPVDLTAVCPGGPSRWETGLGADDFGLSCLTLGMVERQTVVVECAGSSSGANP